MPIQYRTRGNVNPTGKQKVFLTCHPDDFDKYSDEIMKKILNICDCAIWYYPAGEESDLEELEEMTLFVVLVTKKYLIEPNSSLLKDYKYAEENYKAILPLMMEPNIGVLYQLKCKDRQYLDLCTYDETSISVDEKLKKLLEQVVLKEDIIEEIRSAFDAYIFMSYRKKDRKQAQELMRLIHKSPKLRDVAIWYDEFLTPGNDFKEEIEETLSKSDLFVLVVTPSLLEKVNGELNYVARIEYPMAMEREKEIAPVEMVATDREKLGYIYKDLPTILEPEDEESLLNAIVKKVRNKELQSKSKDPKHNYLIGLGYLNGVDVEVNNKKGIELITRAAEEDEDDAILKLIDIYTEGLGTAVDYAEANKWQERLYKIRLSKLGEKHPDTLIALNNLAICYTRMGEREKALELSRKCYELRVKVSGEEHPDSITALNNLAICYSKIGDSKKALELSRKCYELRVKVSGEEHIDSLAALNNVATSYSEIGDVQKALEISKKCYELRIKVSGEEHPDTLTALNNLAMCYSKSRDKEKALVLIKRCYELRVKISGEEHPDSLTALSNLATNYKEAGDAEKALELSKKCYEYMVKILGEEHPDSLTALSNLATNYSEAGDTEKALELRKICYEKRIKVLGKEHPETLIALSYLAESYRKLGEKRKAFELIKRCYEQRVKILGEEHPETLTALGNLAVSYRDMGENKKVLELNKKWYELMVKTLGEEHPDSIGALGVLGMSYMEVGDRKKAIMLLSECYSKSIHVKGVNKSLTTLLESLFKER